ILILYMKVLDQALNEMSYDTFNTIQESYHRFFSKDEGKDLESFVNRETAIPLTLVSRLYKTLEPELVSDEKEAILRLISRSETDQFFLYADSYRNRNGFGRSLILSEMTLRDLIPLETPGYPEFILRQHLSDLTSLFINHEIHLFHNLRFLNRHL
ncbi:MAG: hypothetical protein JXB49_24665, partial [Bacteroidales bacterium]|nr:hypothetical protein [Bacteroidales bacterium]